MVGPGGHGPAGKSAAVPGGRLRRAPAALLLLGDGGVGHAQTARALVSNIEQRNSGGSKSTLLDLAQAFTTGANDTGYTLTGIDMFLYGRHASQTPPTVTLRSGSATGTKVADFTGPSSIGRGDKTYAFTPTTTLTLSASTEYWVVAKGATSYWNDTLLEAEDSGGAPGWTIADVGQSRLTDDGPFFDKYTTAFQFRINGTVNPLVLASNVGQALNDYGSLGSTSDQAQNFTTGDNAAGYTLTGIDLSLRSENTGAVPPTVTLHSGSATGTKVADLTGPPALTAGMTDTYTFTPATTVTLGASTGYWVVAEGGSDDIDWTRTASNAEDATPASGWGIENGSGSRGAAETGNFTASTKSLRLRVKGIPLNNSPAGAPAITAPNVYRVPAVLSVDLSGITDGNGVLGIADTATYTWQRFAAGGTMPEADSIGTDTTYTLTGADAGKTLKVVVSFIDDDGYNEGPLTSASTPAVTAAANCTPPTYAGGAAQVWTRKVVVAKHVDFYGYYDDTTLTFGSLDNTRFSISSNNYQVDRVFTLPGPSLAFSMKSDFTSDELKTLALHICDRAFAFSVVGAPSTGSTYPFNATDFPGAGLDWSTHAERTVYISRDQTSPTFDSATVNGTALVITFSEPLAAAASLANTAFTVKKTPSAGSQTTLTLSSTAPSISGSTVTLALATASSVASSDTNVLVSHTKPATGTANKLVDRFGNETAAFTDQGVDNELADSMDPELSATSPAVLAAGGLTLTLTYSEALKTTSVPDRAVFTVKATPHGRQGGNDRSGRDQRRDRDRQHGGAEAGHTHRPQRRLGQGELREARVRLGDRGCRRQRRPRVLGPGGDQQQPGAARQHRGAAHRRLLADRASCPPAHALEHRDSRPAGEPGRNPDHPVRRSASGYPHHPSRRYIEGCEDLPGLSRQYERRPDVHGGSER